MNKNLMHKINQTQSLYKLMNFFYTVRIGIQNEICKLLIRMYTFSIKYVLFIYTTTKTKE